MKANYKIKGRFEDIENKKNILKGTNKLIIV